MALPYDLGKSEVYEANKSEKVTKTAIAGAAVAYKASLSAAENLAWSKLLGFQRGVLNGE
jgi:hypothetical protein